MPGLSKLSRVVNYFARRPQVQEQLTEQIASYLQKKLRLVCAGICSLGRLNLSTCILFCRPRGVGVAIMASHMCMALRGVNHRLEFIYKFSRIRVLVDFLLCNT